MRNPLFCLLVALALAGGGCRDSHSHAEKPGEHAGHKHAHVPPHGGTAVELGEEAAHIEFVRDATAGKLQAYVLDGELEQFIRVPAESFEVIAKVDGREETLRFQAVASAATGEKVGDTSQFEASAEWLKATAKFEAVLKKLEVRGRVFEGVTFKFPEGNEAHGNTGK